MRAQQFRALGTSLVVVSILAVALILTLIAHKGASGASVVEGDFLQSEVEQDRPLTRIDKRGRVVPVTYDDLLVEIGNRLPGFGGLARDPHDKAVTIVYLRDPSHAESAETAIRDVLGPDFLREGGIRTETAEYEIAQLRKWRKKLSPLAFNIPGVVMTDLDEGQNRVAVGVSDLSVEPEVRDLAESLRIPEAALILQVAGLGQATASITDHIRPIEGGIQIEAFPSDNLCTLGFTTTRIHPSEGTDTGFVTASHCSNSTFQLDVSSTWVGQPTRATASNDIGTEHVDLAAFSCAYAVDCRYSDASFFDGESGVSVDLGYIARTFSIGSKTISTTNPQWRITAEDGFPALNDEVQRVGRSSGWRRGDVANTCADWGADYNDDGFTDYVLLCTYAVDDLTGMGGDSGGPVFEITNSPQSGDVSLTGIMWGTWTNPQTELVEKFLFSSIGNIYGELGSNATWNSCYSGC